MSSVDPGPVVVLGMNRSGTTVVAELVRALGVDLGTVTALMEPQPMVDLHEWLLRRSGGSWEYPLPMLDLLAVPELREEAQRHVSDFARSHFGDRLPAEAPSGGRVHWGWKDPRTVFTLPLWEDAFPRMRLLVVRRHGFDTALSLRARARKELAGDNSPLRRFPPGVRARNVILRREEMPKGSVRAQRLGSALSMWGEYNRQIDAVIATTDHPVHDLRLEDLLDDPPGALWQIARFVGLDDARVQAEHALGTVRLREASRASDRGLVAAEAMPRDLELLASYRYGDTTERARPVVAPPRTGA